MNQKKAISKETWIDCLHLRPHMAEGGYYSEQFLSRAWSLADGRLALDTIYYMLTNDSSVGHFHKNSSDIVHFFHAGGPLRYTTIDPAGKLDTFILGPDPTQGHYLQREVLAEFWKASELISGDYGLISEAVVPAFSAEDRIIVSRAELSKLFPHLKDSVLDLAWP